jgi:hypothetical protein
MDFVDGSSKGGILVFEGRVFYYGFLEEYEGRYWVFKKWERFS